MGLISGAMNFISLLTGDEEEAGFPDNWEIKSSPIAVAEATGDKTKAPKETKGQGKTTKPDKAKTATAEKPALTAADRRSLLERGASELLILFQREGRLVDFLEQDIDEYDDEDVGTAVRDIHKGCRKVLREHFAIAPVLEGVEEDDDVTVPKGFNPGEIRLVGKVKGDPPFKGTLRHHGWKSKKINLPKVAEDVDTSIIASAEVEL